MAEYIFEGDVMIDGTRHSMFPGSYMVTQAVSVKQARNNFIWQARQKYNLTKKLWVDVDIDGIICTSEDYYEAKKRQNEEPKVQDIIEALKEETKPKNSAEQLAFPIDELIKK